MPLQLPKGEQHTKLYSQNPAQVKKKTGTIGQLQNILCGQNTEDKSNMTYILISIQPDFFFYTKLGNIHLSHYLTGFDPTTDSKSKVTASEVNLKY